MLNSRARVEEEAVSASCEGRTTVPMSTPARSPAMRRDWAGHAREQAEIKRTAERHNLCKFTGKDFTWARSLVELLRKPGTGHKYIPSHLRRLENWSPATARSRWDPTEFPTNPGGRVRESTAVPCSPRLRLWG